ncbi:MAG: M20 family metallo-hydrolase [Desulfovibrio sp.]
MFDSVFSILDGKIEDVVSLQGKLVSIPALGPLNGGDGEKDKAEFFKSYLNKIGMTDIQEFNAPDSTVPCGYRPNVMATIPGKDTSRTLWIIAHIDVVPPGEADLWNTDPYTLHREGDKIYGRGVEDNHQGLVSGLMMAEVLIKENITPAINVAILAVADEETGNTFGLEYMVESHPDLFGKNDFFLVPDSGEENGEEVEVAEKSMMWAKVTVVGKQCHASTPNQGNNSLVAAAAMIIKVRNLYNIFNERDELFSPAVSTFEPTMKEANVTNVNTLPGKDVFYIDCRVLPQYDLNDIYAQLEAFAKETELEFGVKITLEVVQSEQAAPATDANCEFVQKLSEMIKLVYNNNPRPVGIGGGTVAAILRRKGFDAIVWSSLMHNAHQPNESSSLSKTIGDAKVMAALALTL